MPGRMNTRGLLRNTGTNLLGRLVAAGSNLIAAPIIIHAIGREGFGVVTFTLSLLALSALLDLGLAATTNRAIAQSSARGGDVGEHANLLRTFELIHWCGAAVIIGTTFAVSGWAARDWLHLSTLNPSDAALVVSLTGLMLGFRFPVGLYSGILFGLRRHGAQNLILGGASIVRYLGGAAIVVLVSPSVVSYSKWLALTGLGEAIAAAAVAWSSVGGRRSFLQSRFQATLLAQHWRFSLVLAAAGAIGSLTASLDRIFLGKTLPVADLGLYGLLYTPAGALTMVATALALTTFPEFAAATGVLEVLEVRRLFLRTQVLTLICVALIAVPLAIHFGPVLRIWTHDRAIAHDGLVPGVILLAALAANALANPAYIFMVASGRPRVALTWNLLTLPLLGASLILLVPRLGLAGAAAAVLAVNALSLAFYLVQTSRILGLDAGAVRGLGRAFVLGASLCVFNLAIAVACKSDAVRIGLSGLTSAAIGGLLFRRLGSVTPLRAVETPAP